MGIALDRRERNAKLKVDAVFAVLPVNFWVHQDRQLRAAISDTHSHNVDVGRSARLLLKSLLSSHDRTDRPCPCFAHLALPFGNAVADHFSTASQPQADLFVSAKIVGGHNDAHAVSRLCAAFNSVARMSVLKQVQEPARNA